MMPIMTVSRTTRAMCALLAAQVARNTIICALLAAGAAPGEAVS
ncbi:MAG: hypothetical protein QOI23_1762, partial [Chloroflexota bacterium]|nr:hypothetical protein [Chloroflexota bacterium]